MESPPCSSPPTTVRRNPPRRAKQTPSAETLPAAPENLQVFLRIRPLQVSLPVPGRKTPKTDSRVIGRGGLPKGGRGKSASCLTVNGPSSVTLLAPPSLLDQKRAKNEVYDGFSFVFPPDSSQQHIYDRVVNPIVMDFMGDKSSLLVALGPTGSGKTYTMFGHGSEPGIVHLILKKLLGYPSEGDVHAKRSYYMSMFEIYAERGKGERILDLSTDGVELSFQNSSLIGLNEVMVSNVQEAQDLLSLGILKRSTAATNANDHSSRSQCIINIHSTENSLNEHNSSNDAVLTIADLAGAERERKTGNQGSRLLESNFINNTSMVFSLCLRSLLEYQRKPKKPLEKHFKNSLLTRYLRDYMEGKKRMTLGIPWMRSVKILTVKPGEDDYADTSFLLRQASPYMKITFTNLEELPRLPIKKRSTSTLVLDRHKRRKTLVPETSLDIEGTCGGDRCDGLSASDKDASTNKLEESSSISTRIPKPAMMETPVNDVLQSELQRLTRQEEIMRKFSKALWSVLKQYKQKLIESENNVQHLTETLSRNALQIMELTKELERLKSCCSCHKVSPVSEASSSEMEFVLNRAGTRMEIPSYENPAITLAKEVDLGIDVCVVLEDQLDANRAVITNSMRPIVQENVLQISSSQAAKLMANDQNFGWQNHQSPYPNLADVHHVKSNDKYGAGRVLKEKNEIVPNSSKAGKPKRKLLPASAMLLKELSGLDMEDTREKTSEVKQGSSQNCVSLFNLLRKQS